MLSFLKATHIGIGRNAAIKLGAEVLGRLATFVLALIAARNLSPTDFGLYNYGLALGFVVAQLADFGLQMLISREVAVRGRDAQPMVASALRLKLLLSLAVLILLVVLTSSWSGEVRLALLALGLMMLAQTFLEFTAHVYRGQQMLGVEAGLLAGSRLFMGLLGIAILLLTGNFLLLALGNLAAVALAAGFSLLMLLRARWLQNDPPNELSGAGKQFNVYLLRQAMPIGLAIFFSIAYTRLAVLILQARGGAAEVATFSAAQRLVEPAAIVPAALVAAVFPVYALALQRDRREARSLGVTVSLLLAAGGLSLAVLLWFLAPWLIPALYGPAYDASIPVLQILGLSAVFTFVNYSLTHYLIARGRQTSIVAFTAAMLVMHGLLSWLLVPLLGPVGPAVSIVAAEALLFAGCMLTLLLKRPVAVHAAPHHAADPDPAGSYPAL